MSLALAAMATADEGLADDRGGNDCRVGRLDYEEPSVRVGTSAASFQTTSSKHLQTSPITIN